MTLEEANLYSKSAETVLWKNYVKVIEPLEFICLILAKIKIMSGEMLGMSKTN